MDNLVTLLKSHWYYVLGAVIGIWLVLKLIRGSSSASSSNSGSSVAGSSITYPSTNANDAAIQVAQIQAQSNAASDQIALSQAVNLAQIQEHATENTNSADVSIAGIKAANALAITNSNNSAAVQINGQNQVTAINGQNTSLAATENTNATKLAAYGIQANVMNNQITAASQVAQTAITANSTVQQTYINDQAKLNSQYMTTQATNLQSVLAEVARSGGFNSQHGGANSTAAVAAVLNPSQAGIASLGASNADGTIDKPQGIAGILASIGQMFGGSSTSASGATAGTGLGVIFS